MDGGRDETTGDVVGCGCLNKQPQQAEECGRLFGKVRVLARVVAETMQVW